MAIVSESPQSHCYDIKSADLSLLALVLKTTDIQAISQALEQQLAESPGFFEQDPVIIDVSWLTADNDVVTLNLESLLPLLRQHGLLPLAIKGAQSALLNMPRGWAWLTPVMPAFGVLCPWLNLFKHKQDPQLLNH